MPVPFPDHIGKYPLTRELGRGGMGVVYLGRHPELDIPVAIKVLPRELVQRDASFAARFLQEARTTALISHPHVVRIFDVGQDGDRQFLVMEYVPGGSVRDLFARTGPLPVATALHLASGIAEALRVAAKYHIVHRDIKPDNILLDADGTPKLADLGMAKCMATTEASVTTTGVAMGTPYYMAPEQARNAKNVDARADLYALGATLFHLLSGRPPFDGESALDILLRHLNDPLPDPRQIRPDLPANVVAILARLLEKDPALRYPDAEALLVDLKAVRERQAPVAELAAADAFARLAAGPPSVPSLRGPPPGATTLPAAPATPPRPRRWPYALAASLLLVAVLLLLLAIRHLQQRQPQTQRLRPPLAAAASSPTPPLADLAPLSDRFERAASLAAWQPLHQQEAWPWNPVAQLDLGRTRPGWLTLIPHTTGWYGELRGPFLFRLVNGDFIATTTVRVSSLDGQGVPQADYSVAGLMVRAPRDLQPASWQPGGENHFFLALGSASDSRTWYFETKTTRRSTSQVDFSPADVDHARLRVVRLANTFLLLTCRQREPWILRARFHRPDLPAALQVGLVAASGYHDAAQVGIETYNRQGAPGGAHDLMAQYDECLFARPTSAAAALRDLDLGDPAAVPDARLLALFGTDTDQP